MQKVTIFHVALSMFMKQLTMAEILSTSNTGSMPTENPQLGFSGMVPAGKQVLILLV